MYKALGVFVFHNFATKHRHTGTHAYSLTQERMNKRKKGKNEGSKEEWKEKRWKCIYSAIADRNCRDPMCY